MSQKALPHEMLTRLTVITEERFPMWNIGRLREFVGAMLDMVVRSQSELPEHDCATARIPEAGTMYVTFDGKGGLNIEPRSNSNRIMAEAIEACRLVMGDKLTTNPGPFDWEYHPEGPDGDAA
jgi:hypothetical protein